MSGGGIQSPALDRVQQWAIIAAAAGAILSVLGLLWYGGEFLQSYLFAYMFWLGIALGSLALLMLHNVTGGAWGVAIRQFLLSATRTLPLLAVMFIPILLGLRWLYPWADPAVVAESHVLQHRKPYLNETFFTLRVGIYFFIWIGLALLMNFWLVRQDRQNDARRARIIQRCSGIGLALYGLTISFASIDWVMSLEKVWYSTIFGFMFMVGQALSTLAFVILLVAILHARHPLADFVTRGHFHDLGNLLLTFVILWAYLAYSQYVIIWSGNIPEEVEWYVHRNHGALLYIAFVLVVLHFFVPFLLLLSRKTKQQIGVLAAVALALLVMRLLDLFWLVIPSFGRKGFFIRWTDLAAPLLVGGIWVTAFVFHLRNKPLLLNVTPEDAEGHAHA